MKIINKKNAPWIIASLSIIVLIFVWSKLYVLQRNYQKDKKMVAINMAELHQQLNNAVNNLAINFENDEARLDLKKTYIDDNYNLLKLSDLVKDKIIVFRFTESDCMECVYSVLPFLDTLENKLGKGKIIVLSTFNAKEAMVAFSESNNIWVPMLLVEGVLNNKLSLEKGTHKSPYFFLLNKEGNTRNFFLPDEYFPELTRMYFEKMYRLLK